MAGHLRRRIPGAYPAPGGGLRDPGQGAGQACEGHRADGDVRGAAEELICAVPSEIRGSERLQLRDDLRPDAFQRPELRDATDARDDVLGTAFTQLPEPVHDLRRRLPLQVDALQRASPDL